MVVRRFVVAAVLAGAVAGPAALGVSAPVQVQSVIRAVDKTTAEVTTINLDVTRNGSLAATLTWSGGSGPYDVLIEPTKGERYYETGVDETRITLAADPDRGYCFEVFGSDGSESRRECLSPPR